MCERAPRGERGDGGGAGAERRRRRHDETASRSPDLAGGCWRNKRGSRLLRAWGVAATLRNARFCTGQAHHSSAIPHSPLPTRPAQRPCSALLHRWRRGAVRRAGLARRGAVRPASARQWPVPEVAAPQGQQRWCWRRSRSWPARRRSARTRTRRTEPCWLTIWRAASIPSTGSSREYICVARASFANPPRRLRAAVRTPAATASRGAASRSSTRTTSPLSRWSRSMPAWRGR
eukprot:COSAG04_NODE_340_length_16315_cov_1278.534410_13_plen_233_part_00